jgi:hypothetical protein
MERFDLEKRRYLAETEQVHDSNSSLYLNWPRALQELADREPMYQVRYSQLIFSDIGRACLVAVLDLIHSNP